MEDTSLPTPAVMSRQWTSEARPQRSLKSKMSSDFMARRRMFEAVAKQSSPVPVTKLGVTRIEVNSKRTVNTSFTASVPQHDPEVDQFISSPPPPTAIQALPALPILSTSSSSLQRQPSLRANVTKAKPSAHVRLSNEFRPAVPERKSSINARNPSRRDSRRSSKRNSQPTSRTDLVSLHRQSCQLFSSIDDFMAQQRDSTTHDSVDFTAPASIIAYLSAMDDYGVDTNSKTSCEIRDSGSYSSPLELTLDRKRSSLPKLSRDDQPAAGNVPEPFVSALPTLPPTPPELSTSSPITHRREASKYRVFPPQSPEPRLPMISVHSYSSNPNVDKQHPTSTAPVCWTSPETRRVEYAKIDRAQRPERKLLRKFTPKWLCGSMGGDRSAFHGDRNSSDDDDSVRRYRVNDEGEDLPRTGYGTFDEKGFESQQSTPVLSQGGFTRKTSCMSLRKKASAVFQVKERGSSTTDLLDQFPLDPSTKRRVAWKRFFAC